MHTSFGNSLVLGRSCKLSQCFNSVSVVIGRVMCEVSYDMRQGKRTYRGTMQPVHSVDKYAGLAAKMAANSQGDRLGCVVCLSAWSVLSSSVWYVFVCCYCRTLLTLQYQNVHYMSSCVTRALRHNPLGFGLSTLWHVAERKEYNLFANMSN